MKRAKTILFLTVVVVGVAGFFLGRASAPEGASGHDHTAEAPAAAPVTWTCSMHPQVRLPGPGQCPICFMDLTPASEGDDEDLGPRVLRMTESAAALAEIVTAPVERREVTRSVPLVGKVAFDETRVSTLTTWVPGRLERLFVDFTGVAVREGDHLVEIYSPTLYSAQQELLQAIATAKKLEASSLEILRTTSDRTVVSARERLRLFGLTEAQVAEVVERGSPSEQVTLHAPSGGIVIHKNALEGMYVDEGTQIYTIADLSRVWVLLDAYESDLAWLRYGQDVTFEAQAFPGETFRGTVAFIDPVLDDRTRTVKVRLIVENEGLRLKPDMFVSATAEAKLDRRGRVVDADLAARWMCPMHPEIVADELEACSECGMDLVPAAELGFVPPDESAKLPLVIPATAPLFTGERSVVYVRVPGMEKPTFEGRMVTLGPRAGDWYVVRLGLAEGEEVVVHGNFKIDSELQIRAKPSMMAPDPADADPPPLPQESPVRFREQLGLALAPCLRLQTAFAADGDDPEAARATLEALRAIDSSALEQEALTVWYELWPELLEAANALAGAPDLEQRRVALYPFTEALVVVLDVFDYAREEGRVGLFHCPMAFDDTGADWIQEGDTVANPYFGSAMLRCGTKTRVLESVE